MTPRDLGTPGLEIVVRDADGAVLGRITMGPDGPLASLEREDGRARVEEVAEHLRRERTPRRRPGCDIGPRAARGEHPVCSRTEPREGPPEAQTAARRVPDTPLRSRR